MLGINLCGIIFQKKRRKTVAAYFWGVFDDYMSVFHPQSMKTDGLPHLSFVERNTEPKMSPTISLSGMYRKSFIYRRNRTNYQ